MGGMGMGGMPTGKAEIAMGAIVAAAAAYPTIKKNERKERN